MILSNQLAIRLLRKGCANRPFYHIVVALTKEAPFLDGVEQLGVYDPMPNELGEQLLTLNVQRFKHYVAEGAFIRASVGKLLGAAGVLPLHPHTLRLAWRKRQSEMKALNKDESNSAE